MGERERTLKAEDMATTSTAVATVPAPLQEEPTEPIAVITLKATRTRQRKKVVWTEDTIDNEDMNKKKSKCCCIYEKPHKFDDPDSEDSDDECEHCFGHVERRKMKMDKNQPSTSTELQDPPAAPAAPGTAPAPERSATLTLRAEPPPAPPAPPDPPASPAPAST